MAAVEQTQRLAETDLGLRWIQQFPNEAQSDAELLLDTLSLVSADQFYIRLRACVEGIASHLSTKAALYAVKDLDESDAYFPDKRSSPNAAQTGGTVGSEAPAAYLARALRDLNRNKFLNHPPIQILRKERCHHIILLDDISSSGDTLLRFLRAQLREKSLRSWWSFGWITYHIVAYTISRDAEVRVLRSLRSPGATLSDVRVDFSFVQRPVSSEALWPEEITSRIRQFCIEFGKGLGWRSKPLGYKDTFANVVFHHMCPNNVPGVLWETGGTTVPLFPNRRVPTELLPLFGATQESDAVTARRLAALGEKKVAEGKVINHATLEGQNMLVVLAAIKKGHSDIVRISEATGLPIPGCNAAIDRCREFLWIDGQGYLTESGIRELQAARRNVRLPMEPPPLTGKFYFPRALREAR